MTEYGRFIPPHFPFPDLGRCRFLYCSLKLREFLWGFPFPLLRCAIHSQSGAASQCKIAVIFEEDEAQLVRPWHFLFPLLSMSCSGPAVNYQRWKSSLASAERTMLYLQDIFQVDVSLSGPAGIHVAELHLSGSLLLLGHLHGFLPIRIIHGAHLFCLWIPCRCMYSTHSIPFADER